ncbi:hypothetical protein BGW36DRAFT_377965, partial [Talaromyces proteolyticus]
MFHTVFDNSIRISTNQPSINNTTLSSSALLLSYIIFSLRRSKMPTFYDLDPKKPFRQQLEEETGTVVFTNTFTIPEGKIDEALATWKRTAEILKYCPGFISTQMHQGVDSHILINVSVWESAHHLRDGLNREDFKAVAESFPQGTQCRAHLFRRLHVEGICAA